MQKLHGEQAELDATKEKLAVMKQRLESARTKYDQSLELRKSTFFCGKRLQSLWSKFRSTLRKSGSQSLDYNARQRGAYEEKVRAKAGASSCLQLKSTTRDF